MFAATAGGDRVVHGAPAERVRRHEGQAVRLSEVRRGAAAGGGRAARERPGGRGVQRGGTRPGALPAVPRELRACDRRLVAHAPDGRRARGLSPEPAAPALPPARHQTRPAARRRWAARFGHRHLVARLARTSRTPDRWRQHAHSRAPEEMTHDSHTFVRIYRFYSMISTLFYIIHCRFRCSVRTYVYVLFSYFLYIFILTEHCVLSTSIYFKENFTLHASPLYLEVSFMRIW